jgi:hypothetical protein
MSQPKREPLKRKSPPNIDGDGDSGSFYHLCEMSDRVRLQVNARDVLYLKSRREIRRIHTWLERYLKGTARGRSGRKSGGSDGK